MIEQSLTPRDRVVLMALMALAEDVNNNELEERVGFRLEGAARQRVNALGFVDSQKVGRGYRHEITESGLAWCRREMTAPHPARSDSGTRSLYAVLATLNRYLERADVPLSEIFQPVPRELDETELEALEKGIRAAYADLAEDPGDWVGFTELRQRLSGTPREHVDLALLRLSTADGVNIVPDANQGGLTPEDRAAAVAIGGQDKHLITIREV